MTSNEMLEADKLHALLRPVIPSVAVQLEELRKMIQMLIKRKEAEDAHNRAQR